MQHVRFGLTLLAVGLAAACAHPPARTPEVPENLKAPGEQLMTLKAHAKGVQIYLCRTLRDDVMRYEWALTGPEATLTDAVGRRVAHHFAGPTWQATDGSEVVGEVVARADSEPPGAIPQLLLKAKSNSGTGRFSRVRSIQRLNTRGGTPQSPCAAPQAGQSLRVDYTADYYFYVDATH